MTQITDIKLLHAYGFTEMPNKNGMWSRVNDNEVETVLIFLPDGRYKLEIYQWVDDGEGNWYKDFDKVYSNDQTLEEFIQFWVV